ncbi:MAG: RNA-binding cell elongation regulator Jag/EloR [Lachnospiraceae bacterium]
MDYITVTAKTLDDAITDALVQLGVTSDKLDYEVIEKGSAGFLGIGMKQAVIKARRKEEPVEEEIVEDISAEEKVVVKETKEHKKSDKKAFHKKDKSEKINKFEKKERAEKNMKPEKVEKPVEKSVEKTEKPVKEESVKTEVELAKVEEATISTCKKFVEDVLASMGMEEVTVTTEIDEEGALCINMDGPNMGIMIGKRGQTLDSLQYLTNRVANKMQDGYVRVKLDTEDYRRRRKQTLENLAKNIASKVKRTRRTVSLEPMNPYERRIIHSALQSDPAVSTHSEGEEPYRRVVVTLVRK